MKVKTRLQEEIPIEKGLEKNCVRDVLRVVNKLANCRFYHFVWLVLGQITTVILLIDFV